MAEKQRYNVSVPAHVASIVERNARAIGATPTEYAGDVIRWWFGQGCPPVRHDEAKLQKIAGDLPSRILAPPQRFDVWKLEVGGAYELVDDLAEEALKQLGIPNLFSHHKEHDKVRLMVAFDNHPTHWLIFNLFKGANKSTANGLSLSALPKSAISRDNMMLKLAIEAKKMDAQGPVVFSQIPNVPSRNASSFTSAST